MKAGANGTGTVFETGETGSVVFEAGDAGWTPPRGEVDMSC